MTSGSPSKRNIPHTHSRTGERLSCERGSQTTAVTCADPIADLSAGQAVIIDTASEPGSWAETLASPSCKLGHGKKLRVLDLFSGYTIQEDGEVRSRFGRIVKPQVGRSGYVRIELSTNGVGKKYLLHRLLALAFIPNPLGKPQVNHIDGNKSNNRLDNLEWVTQSENQLHAYRAGLQRGYKKSGSLSEAHKRALCGSRWRGETRQYIAGGQAFDCPAKAAAHYGLSRQTFYNRAASPKFPDWQIQIGKEVEN